jgi:hypothetical protein
MGLLPVTPPRMVRCGECRRPTPERVPGIDTLCALCTIELAGEVVPMSDEVVEESANRESR